MIEATKDEKARGTGAHIHAAAPLMTRRQLLAGTGQLAVLAMLSTACVPIVNAPWADGTFWDDGKGWTD